MFNTFEDAERKPKRNLDSYRIVIGSKKCSRSPNEPFRKFFIVPDWVYAAIDLNELNSMAIQVSSLKELHFI